MAATKEATKKATAPRRCRVCGCADDDCKRCVERTGQPCDWVKGQKWLCTACERPEALAHQVALKATRLRNRAGLLESDPLSRRYRNGVVATLEELTALLVDLAKAVGPEGRP